MFSLVQNLTSALKAHEAKRVSDGFHKKSGQDTPTSAFSMIDDDDDGVDVSAYQDSAELSVQSLIWFFEDYFATRLDQKDGVSSQGSSQTIRPWMKNAHSNSNDAHPSPSKVANTYAKNNVSSFRRTSSKNAENIKVRDELKSLYVLLQDLRILRDHGVETLEIRYDKPFMRAVSGAVDEAKQAS